MKRLLFITIMLLFMVATPAMAEGRFVQKIVDGETLKLLSGEKVRLIGIDVPKDIQAGAVDFIRSLVSGSVVALEFDVEKADENGNILAYVWFKYHPRVKDNQIVFPDYFDVHYVVDGEGDGDFFVLLNTTIVKAGYAQPLEALPNDKYTALIKKLYDQGPIETAKVESEIHAKATIE